MTDAFYMIPSRGNETILIFGDHASKHIPEDLDGLGLSQPDLTRHIAWDIGTETIIRSLCRHFKCTGQLAGVSRLVIDMNRDPDAVDLIPSESDGTQIRGNQNLTHKDIEKRVKAYHVPYHQNLTKIIKTSPIEFVLSIHSFTPKPKSGPHRPTDIGLLVKHDVPTAERFKGRFESSETSLKIAINKPYTAHEYNYTMDANVAPYGLRHLAIEIRQDHIGTYEDALRMADSLALYLTPFVQAQNEGKLC